MTDPVTASGQPGRPRRIAIDPLTRVEGHGKITLLLDEEGRVAQARLHIVEFRGFEKFIEGRPYWEVPVAVQRLCGICPVSHLVCAAKAMDQVVGAGSLTPSAEKIRRLMHYGQILQSHALHFFHLASPDLLFGFDAEVGRRNLIGLIAAHPDLARRGVLLRRFGQEVIRVTAGKRIHGTGAVPGGVNRLLDVGERDRLRRELEPVQGWCREAVALVQRLYEEDPERLGAFGSFPAHGLTLVRGDGALELYDGALRATRADGERLFDRLDPGGYREHLCEEVRPWSYMKFPYFRALGPEEGWYRVGPLSRVTGCDFIPTPAAEAERVRFLACDGGRAARATLGYHWARMIEMLHAAEVIAALLDDADLCQGELVRSGARREEGIGVIEAPRGTLIHHYRVDEHDEVLAANLIVATTHNNEAMNRAVREVARSHLDGHTLTEGLLNHLEVAIRAFDPCLSCATHALGAMPLQLELLDAEGRMVDRLRRDCR